MNKQLRTKNVLSFVLVLLTALAAISTLDVQFASALEDHEITTVTVLPTTGGTTSPSPGSHEYANSTVLTTTATPDAGFDFLYWNITGIMNTEDDHDSMGTDISDMEHGGPFGTLSDLDSLILTERSVTITIDCAYTYQYQPVFAPNQNATPITTPTTSAQQQTLAPNNSLTYIAIGIIGLVAAVLAIAGFYIKRKKQANTAQ